MRRLGISVYPNHSKVEEVKQYIELASKYNFKRIFTCLLSVEGNKEQVIEEFKDIITLAKEREM